MLQNLEIIINVGHSKSQDSIKQCVLPFDMDLVEIRIQANLQVI